MRPLGLLLILIGIPLLFTLVLTPVGLMFIAVGALCRMASSKRDAPTSPVVKVIAGSFAALFAIAAVVTGMAVYSTTTTKAASSSIATQHTLKNCTTTAECEAIAHRDAEQARKRHGVAKPKKSPSQAASPARSYPEPSAQ